MQSNRLTVLAVASGGGHWVELLRLRPAWDGADVSYMTTMDGYEHELGCEAGRLLVVPDASMDDKLRLVWQGLRVLLAVLRLRPDVIVSTGAAVGYFAIRAGRLVGARTVWVDSIANAEELSLSGCMIGPHCDLWLTQWEHLAVPGGPAFSGAVL
jgi:UDP-N-acetylglucosamine:LPS N-acetylglucosamine transferase